MPCGCDVVRAIGTNLKSIAAGLLHDWRDGDKAFATVVLSAGEGNTHYFDAKEASLDFAKALRGALLLVQDYKLGRPLGAAPAAERATRAESWRSPRSLRTALINPKAAQAPYAARGEATSPAPPPP